MEKTEKLKTRKHKSLRIQLKDDHYLEFFPTGQTAGQHRMALSTRFADGRQPLANGTQRFPECSPVIEI